MNKSKLLKLSLAPLMCLAVFFSWGTEQASARTYTTETLNYEIIYQWNFVWKHAANAKLFIKSTGNGYYSELTSCTRSWADKIFPVRDTLKCTMNRNFLPIKYEKITHENNKYRHDIVKFSKQGAKTVGDCTRIRQGKATTKITLSNDGNAYDMLSVFYMLRNLDLANMPVNKAYSTTIFSGKRKEALTLKYKGVVTIKMRDGSKRQAYQIEFNFSQDGKTKSSDDLNAYLSTDDKRIPLMLVGKLPIGQVKCYYKG